MIEKSTEDNRFYFQWHFIERCNMKCVHCYQQSYTTTELPLEKLLEIARTMEQTLIKWKRTGRISLTGGEPFLRKDLLLKLLNFFETSEAFYWTGILTNGTLIDEAIADDLKGFTKLKEIQVSLDGASAEVHDAVRGKGSFHKALEAVSLLKRKEFTVSLMFTLHKENRDDAIPLIKLAESLGVDFVTVERMIPYSSEDKQRFYMEPNEIETVYRKIYEIKKELEKKGSLKVRVSRPLWGLIDKNIGGFCPAGFSSLSILHDGTVLPCRRLEIPIGNILTDGLYKIWYTSDVLWKLRNKNKFLGVKCKNCSLLGNCGGCRAVAYALTGDLNASDPQCWKSDTELLKKGV